MRFSVHDYRDDDGRDVLAGRPPYMPDLARQDAHGIDVGMCPVCKRGGVPRRYGSDEVVYLPHSNDGRFCRGARVKR